MVEGRVVGGSKTKLEGRNVQVCKVWAKGKGKTKRKEYRNVRGFFSFSF